MSSPHFLSFSSAGLLGHCVLIVLQLSVSSHGQLDIWFYSFCCLTEGGPSRRSESGTVHYVCKRETVLSRRGTYSMMWLILCMFLKNGCPHSHTGASVTSGQVVFLIRTLFIT